MRICNRAFEGGDLRGFCIEQDLRIDPVLRLDLFKEAVTQIQADVDHADIGPVIEYRRFTADTKTAASDLKTADRLFCVVDFHNRGAEGGEVVSVFIGLMKTQEGEGIRKNELVLLDVKVVLNCFEKGKS